MDMSIAIPSQLPPLFVPVEVCEHIIDMLYSDIDVSEGLQYTATLHSCALVCRAWRIRAQRTLFYSVHLINVASLNKFAAVLQTARHLEAYVYEVTLSGRSLQTTASMLSPFLIIFQAAKLPNLQRLAVLCVLESAQWYPPTSHSASISPKAKPLPHIPLHSHFSTLLSAFTTLSRLELQETRFRSFGEFARMIAALPNLRSLACTSVRWNTLGGAFPAQTTDGTGAWSRPPFPLKLRSLVLWKSGSHAAKWLLSACGRSPSLKSLNIGIPLGGREESETDAGVEIDLSLFSELDELTIMPTSTRFAAEKQYSDLLKAMLTSWKPRCSDPYLRFGAETWTYLFTRDEFACILQVVGAVTENWRTEIADTSGKGEVKHLFFIDLYEQERHLREQWVGCFLDAFPTWLKLGGLIVRIENPHGPAYEWAEDSDRIEKISEPADSTSNAALQREASSSQLACKTSLLRPLVLADKHHPTSLSLAFPLPQGLYEINSERMNPCPSLQRNELQLALSSGLLSEAHAAIIEEVLSSWQPQGKIPLLMFDPGESSEFTRGGLVEALRVVGAIAERVLRPMHETSRASSSTHADTRTRCWIVISVWDSETEGEWWGDQLLSCFPTWARSGQIVMQYLPRKKIAMLPTRNLLSPETMAPRTQLQSVDSLSPGS